MPASTQPVPGNPPSSAIVHYCACRLPHNAPQLLTEEHGCAVCGTAPLAVDQTFHCSEGCFVCAAADAEGKTLDAAMLAREIDDRDWDDSDWLLGNGNEGLEDDDDDDDDDDGEEDDEEGIKDQKAGEQKVEVKDGESEQEK